MRRMTMTRVKRSPGFVADALGLDFLNRFSRNPAAFSGDALLAWLDEARLVPAEVLAAIRDAAVPGELDAVAAQARALGEWFRQFVYKHKGAYLAAGCVHELEPLNRILQHDFRYGQVTVGEADGQPSGLQWQVSRHWRSIDSLLLPIAQVMADLVCNEDFGLVRECEGTGCTILFLDRTRGHGRRWCSMAVCGNRAKQATRRGSLA